MYGPCVWVSTVPRSALRSVICTWVSVHFAAASTLRASLYCEPVTFGHLGTVGGGGSGVGAGVGAGVLGTVAATVVAGASVVFGTESGGGPGGSVSRGERGIVVCGSVGVRVPVEVVGSLDGAVVVIDDVEGFEVAVVDAAAVSVVTVDGDIVAWSWATVP